MTQELLIAHTGASNLKKPIKIPCLPTMGSQRKVRRISRACDFCHQRSIRCRSSEDNSDRCQNCVDFDQPCTYNRPQRRSRRQDLPKNTINEEYATILEDEAVIDELVEVHFEIVYPIYPFHHEQTLLSRIKEREFHTNPSFLANLMAVCALSAARLRDGACPRQLRVDPAPFAKAAKDSIPTLITAARGLDYMRACAMMAMYEMQNGSKDEMQHYLGMYINLVVLDSLHDESRWPKACNSVEQEERRRLFWSMYMLDVFASTMWSGFVRIRETQCNVPYPSETGYQHAGSAGSNDEPWMYGWNFTTELYRMLEHILDTFPARQTFSFPGADIFKSCRPQHHEAMGSLLEMYAHLPPQFKDLRSEVHDHDLSDKLCFQAANIAATFQLVRIVLCRVGSDKLIGKVEHCRDFLVQFSKVPTVFLRAISSPLLYHISCIGELLGSVIQGAISQDIYIKIRETLLGMADFLDILELGHQNDISSSKPLREHIKRIDYYMRENQFLPNNTTLPLPQTTGPPILQYPSDQFQVDLNNNTLLDPNLEIQLPQELLEDFSWTFGMPNGFEYE